MKRIIFLALVGLVSIPAGANAQTAAQMIERALVAAPGRAREGATVVRWNADHTYETLKEGMNTWLCYDRSGEPGRAPFAVQCTSLANLDRIAQNRRFDAEASDRQELRALVAAADADGTRVPAEFASMWISMNGEDQASAGTHTTVAVPGATGESMGLPGNGRAGGAYVMAGGTSEAHIMLPGR